MKRGRNKILDEWIDKEQKKHKLCECGCGREIIIKSSHKFYGIHKYIKSHLGKKYNIGVENE